MCVFPSLLKPYDGGFRMLFVHLFDGCAFLKDVLVQAKFQGNLKEHWFVDIVCPTNIGFDVYKYTSLQTSIIATTDSIELPCGKNVVTCY